jgi:hypothetical protein
MVVGDWRCAPSVMVQTSGRGAHWFGQGGPWGRPGAHGRRAEAGVGRWWAIGVEESWGRRQWRARFGVLHHGATD